MLSGVICLNKPEGFTSFDAVAKLRGILGMKKLGHSGTLDPMATGVLPVFLGGATKAISIMPSEDKSYIAGFQLGIETDTQDITGKILAKKPVCTTSDRLKAETDKFTGNIMQIPPMYSAVSVGGKRLYELARQGLEVERTPRPVTVRSIKILSFDENSGKGVISVSCSKGTYIRTIIHDLGQRLGCGGVMDSLVRTASNGFSLDECFDFGELETLKAENRLNEAIIPVEKLFEALPKILLDERKTKLYKNGVKLRFEQVKGIGSSEKYRVYGSEGFIGIAKADRSEELLRVDKNF